MRPSCATGPGHTTRPRGTARPSCASRPRCVAGPGCTAGFSHTAGAWLHCWARLCCTPQGLAGPLPPAMRGACRRVRLLAWRRAGPQPQPGVTVPQARPRAVAWRHVAPRPFRPLATPPGKSTSSDIQAGLSGRDGKEDVFHATFLFPKASRGRRGRAGLRVRGAGLPGSGWGPSGSAPFSAVLRVERESKWVLLVW